MKQLVLLLAIIYGSTFHTYAQKKDECPILGGTTDTVMCGDKKLILDLKFLNLIIICPIYVNVLILIIKNPNIEGQI